MTLERIEHKVFASEAPLDEMGQFGSALATTKLNTKDVAEIQALPAYTKGWGSAIISENNYPAMEEMNGVLNVMSYHTGYLYQEGVPVYSPSQTYSATSWVKNITGEKIYRSKQDENKGNDLEDSAWWEELNLGGGGGLEIGKPQISLDSILPKDCVWLEGATVSRTTYSQLFALYGTTYGAGDGSTTFKLPDFRNRAIWGSNGFGYLSAGLPNITGQTALKHGSRVTGFDSFSGAIQAYDVARGGDSYAYVQNQTPFGFKLDASKSNSIYGGSTTVQPPAIKVRVYTKYK